MYIFGSSVSEMRRIWSERCGPCPSCGNPVSVSGILICSHCGHQIQIEEQIDFHWKANGIFLKNAVIGITFFAAGALLFVLLFA
jgi:hypothetical protein